MFVLTVNVRSLNNNYLWLKEEKLSGGFTAKNQTLFFPQETFSNPESIKIWQNEFGGKNICKSW